MMITEEAGASAAALAEASAEAQAKRTTGATTMKAITASAEANHVETGNFLICHFSLLLFML